MADERRDYERDELDYRRTLSVEEKVDLLLDRFLGNRLRGTIGQVDVLNAIGEQLRSFNDSQAEMIAAMSRMAEKVDRNHADTAQQFADADLKFTDTNRRLSVIWAYVLANTIGGLFHLMAIAAIAIFVYLLWTTVHADPLAMLYTIVAWRPW